MAKVSAGLLLYRRSSGKLEVLLGHLGGPFFVSKDRNAWGIPKGEVEEGEDLLAAAQREFTEETGLTPSARLIPLGSVKQKSGKVVHAWATEGDFDPAKLNSNTFEIEWPRGSGRLKSFAELDRAAWFDLPAAREKIIGAQAELLDRLLTALNS